MVAVDDDADGNGLLRYTIVSTAGPATPTTGRGGFVIDETTGTVQTTGSFDREEFRGPYTIIVSIMYLLMTMLMKRVLGLPLPPFPISSLSLPPSLPPSFSPPSSLLPSHSLFLPPSLCDPPSLLPSLAPDNGPG